MIDITRDIINDLLKYHYIYFNNSSVTFRLSTDVVPKDYSIDAIFEEIVAIIDGDEEIINDILNEIVQAEVDKSNEVVTKFFKEVNFNSNFKFNLKRFEELMPLKQYSEIFRRNMFNREFVKHFIAPLVVKSSKTWDYAKRSKYLFKKFKEMLPCDIPKELMDTMITPIFVKQYFKVKQHALDKLLKKLTNKQKYFLKLQEELTNELPIVADMAEAYFYDNFKNEALDEKIKDFLSQLIVYLGTHNWVVFWVGHGKIKNVSKLYELMGESKKYQPAIRAAYEKWYDDAVVAYSTKIIDKK